MDKQGIQKACKEYEQKHGKGSVFMSGSKNSVLDIPRWTTGIEDLDEIIGGGMPRGRIIEVFGPESSGKTSLAFHLVSMVELGAYIPIEGTYDEARAKQMGVKKGQMVVFRCDYGEEAMDTIVRLAKTGIPLIILDSVPACQPKKEAEKKEKDSSQLQKMGAIALMFSEMLPTIRRICEKSGTTLVLINQVRDNMNAMMFGDKDTTPGGRAIRFYSSIRMKLARRAWIEIPNKNPKVSAETLKVGMVMKVRVVKSKVCNPYMEAELPLMFDYGYVSFDDAKAIRKELMSKNKRAKDDE